MNVGRVRQLADHLRALPREKFEMESWLPTRQDLGGSQRWWLRGLDRCGTAACAAGHACHLFLPICVDYVEDVQETAQHLLGLSDEQCGRLFVPAHVESFDATPAQAAAVLDHLAETGVVDWARALREF